MKKLLILYFVLSFCLTGCSNNSKENNSENYIASRTATNSTSENNNQEEIDTQEQSGKQNNETSIEEELSSFSTKIYTPNDEARQNNITITCSNLNNTIVKPGETFSFCDTVGKATPERRLPKSRCF